MGRRTAAVVQSDLERIFAAANRTGVHVRLRFNDNKLVSVETIESPDDDLVNSFEDEWENAFESEGRPQSKNASS